jgi:hypothetical protein
LNVGNESCHTPTKTKLLRFEYKMSLPDTILGRAGNFRRLGLVGGRRSLGQVLGAAFWPGPFLYLFSLCFLATTWWTPAAMMLCFMAQKNKVK